MAFFERMNEIGSIRAIGVKRSQVFALLTQEGLFLSVLAGLIGLVMALVVGAGINGAHLTYAAPSISEPVPLYIDLTITNSLFPVLLVVVATLLAVMIPAFKASRLTVVDVLRHL